MSAGLRGTDEEGTLHAGAFHAKDLRHEQVEQAAGGGIGIRWISEKPEGRYKHPALAIGTLHRDGHRLVNPADHQPGADSALEIHEITAGDHELRDHAVESLVDERSPGNGAEASRTPEPGEGRGPIPAPQRAVAVL